MTSHIAVNPGPAPHLAQVVAALQAQGDVLDRQRLFVNLTAGDVTPPAGLSCIECIVEDDHGAYRLAASDAAAWSGVAGSNRARLRVLRRHEDPSASVVLADGEVRISRTRPWNNARELGAAFVALIRAGALSRPTGPAWQPRFAARPGAIERLQDGLRWFGACFLPSVWQSLKWRAGFPDRQQWTIGVLPRASLDPGRAFPWTAVRWISPPSDGLIADPCLVEAEGRHWLFYEHMRFTDARATLHAAALDPTTGTLTEPREVLKEPYHLSFPNVFRHAGDWYMLPEQGQSGATRLYRARAFPDSWEHHRDLLPGFAGLDPVLLQYDGRWWLFVTRDNSPCVDDNLHLFFSDRFDGDFVPHPMNPIKTGLFGSRMAGLIIEQAGRLIRPGQDGRNGYGHGLVLHEITTLTPDDYAEALLCAWSPETDGRFRYGLHALDVCGEFAVVDAQQIQRRVSGASDAPTA